jgi:hypothetical protein
MCVVSTSGRNSSSIGGSRNRLEEGTAVGALSGNIGGGIGGDRNSWEGGRLGRNIGGRIDSRQPRLVCAFAKNCVSNVLGCFAKVPIDFNIKLTIEVLSGPLFAFAHYCIEFKPLERLSEQFHSNTAYFVIIVIKHQLAEICCPRVVVVLDLPLQLSGRFRRSQEGCQSTQAVVD